jgi:hypothetical protein
MMLHLLNSLVLHACHMCFTQGQVISSILIMSCLFFLMHKLVAAMSICKFSVSNEFILPTLNNTIPFSLQFIVTRLFHSMSTSGLQIFHVCQNLCGFAVTMKLPWISERINDLLNYTHVYVLSLVLFHTVAYISKAFPVQMMLDAVLNIYSL